MGRFNHMNTNPNINTIISNQKPFFITAYYKKSKDTIKLFMNGVSPYQIIPYDCRLKEITCYFYNLDDNNDYLVTLNIEQLCVKRRHRSSEEDRMPTHTRPKVYSV